MTFRKPQTAAEAEQFLNFFATSGVDLLNLAALVPAADAARMIMEGGKRARGRAEIERSLGWAWMRNATGANIYARPARYRPDGSRAEWPVVFLDDLTPAMATGIARKYRSIAVETSADNFQTWIVVSRPLNEHERLQVQRALVQLAGADPGSASGEHFGRFPGFHNRKTGRNGHAIRIWRANEVGLPLNPSPYLENVPRAAGAIPGNAGGGCPRQRRDGTGADASESSREFRFAIARLRAGRPAEEIVDAVFQHALARGKRNGAPHMVRSYAETTVSKAAAWARI
jgi:hypothetical protein